METLPDDRKKAAEGIPAAVPTLGKVAPAEPGDNKQTDHTDSTAEESSAQSGPADAAESTGKLQTKRPRRWRKVLLLSTLIFVALLNGAGVYGNVYLHKKVLAKTTTASPNPASSALSSTPAATNPPPATPQVTTLHYVSNALHVEFDYPVDWRIGGTADDKSLSLTSAPFSIPDATGAKQAGTIQLTIADPSQEQGTFGFLNDNDVISADSQGLDYANPTSVQRKATNISFEAVTASDAQKGVSDFIFISGNLAYHKGQTLGSKNYQSITPHIYAYFDPCHVGDGHCQAFITMPISQTTWENDPNFNKLRSLVGSLRFSQ